MIRKAEDYLENDDIRSANEIVKKILNKKRDYIPAHYLRAKILMMQKQYLMAISNFNNILSMPDFNKFINEPEIHNYLANLYNETKNYSKEIEEYKIILTFNPDDVQANYRIGHALYKKEDYLMTKEHFSRALALDPSLTTCYLPFGISCFNTSDYKKSEEYLINSMKMQGDHSEAKYFLGLIMKMKKDYDGAITLFDDARRNNKYFAKSQFSLGEICFERQEYKEAVDYLESGLKKLDGNDDFSNEYRYLLAECYELENRLNDAMSCWKIIAQDSPNFRSTKLKLESYKDIFKNKYLMDIFSSSIDKLYPVITGMVNNLDYSVISKEQITANEIQIKTINIKRTNDPPVLVYFHRTTKDITEGQIIDFHKRINNEKCKSGMYFSTSKFSLRAKNSASSKMVDLYDSEYITRSMSKIEARNQMENK